MAFDLTIWKEKLAARLPGWKRRMKQAGVNSTYAFISAATLWPVIEAVGQGEWAAPAALGGVLAGLGSNLLANQIQGWKNEADAARHLEKAATKDAALRAELDAVLDKLEALPLAEQSLSEADRAWFTRTMQEELAHLGSSVTYQATVTGGGAVAQGDGATAVGAGGMYVSGSVKGDVLGPGATKTTAPDPGQIEQARIAAARRQYLERLSVYCQALPLAALDDPEAETEIKLDDVYIALNTTAEIEPPQKEKRSPLSPEKQPLPGWDAFLKTPRLALLGSPGSGKSTFVRKALALQAQAMLKEKPLPGVGADLLPVLVTLRDLIPRLETVDVGKLSSDRKRAALLTVLRQQIETDLQADGLYPAPAFAPTLLDALDRGAVLLALDGLDELPERLKERVQELFTALLTACRPQRVVLTCRIRSYSEGARRKDFQDFTLAPLTRQQINDFCRAWYRTRLGQRDPEAARLRGESLASAALDGKLRSLAENPMLLTAMAIVHFKETRLPNERVKLYSKVVEILLERWQRHKGAAVQAISDELEKLLSDSKSVRAILERLAYQAHQVERGNADAADLPGQATRELLAGEFLNRNYNLAAEFLDYVDQRAGLLLGRGGAPGQPSSYAFAHRTFQEYLAGCYIVNLRRPEKEITKLALEPEFWSLAVQFGAEELFYNGLSRSRDDMLDLAEALFEPGLANIIQRRTALWAGKMLAVAGAEIVNQRCPDLAGQMLPALQTLLGSDLAPVERAEAGDALAKLGDPRPEVTSIEGMQFCFVPPGPFVMGGDQYDDEKPQHLNECLSYPYWIARYPVTVAQWRVFVESAGFKYERWRYNTQPNHPVVDATWYEALEFCKWLNSRYAVQLPQGYAFSLPSEAEWEKAARGGVEIPRQNLIRALKEGLSYPSKLEMAGNPDQKREYPWEGEFDPNKANTRATGIDDTSAVGCFPGGVSLYGALEMSGNVFEWTSTKDESYPYNAEDGREDPEGGVHRVLRGGSFDLSADLARCAFRLRGAPDGWLNGWGFRVVVSRTSHNSEL